MKQIYGTFGVEMRAYGQKLVKFCKHTHASPIDNSSIDTRNGLFVLPRTAYPQAVLLTSPPRLLPYDVQYLA